MAVAFGVATHVVITIVLSHYESTTYTFVEALLSWSAGDPWREGSQTHNEPIINPKWNNMFATS